MLIGAFFALCLLVPIALWLGIRRVGEAPVGAGPSGGAAPVFVATTTTPVPAPVTTGPCRAARGASASAELELDRTVGDLPAVDLVLVQGPADARSPARIIKPNFLVGSSDFADLIVRDSLVSARHATVQLYANGKVFVRDEGSTNGTFVDGIRVPRGGRVALKAGQTVSFSQAATFRLVPLDLRSSGPKRRGRRPRTFDPRERG